MKLAWKPRNSLSARDVFIVIAQVVAIIAMIAILRSLPPPLPHLSSIPADKMPSVNAFDTFNSAAALQKEPHEIVIAGASTTTPTQVLKHLVAENLPVLALVRIGLTQQYASPPRRDIFLGLPRSYDNFRILTRLLTLQAQVEKENNDYSGACATCIDAIEFGSKVPQGAGPIGLISGVAFESMGRRQLFRFGLVDHLRSVESKNDASRLAKIDETEVPPWLALREAEWEIQGTVVTNTAGRDWQKRLKHTFNLPKNDEHDPDAGMAVALLGSLSPFFYRDFTQYMNRMILFSQEPWPRQLHGKPPDIPYDDPAVKMLLPILDVRPYKILVNLAEDRLLETHLALRAYYLDHKVYPATLSLLIPNYLPAVPIDPFSDNQPLRYRQSGKTYVLYSIGPDAVDDGGRPMDNTAFLSKGLKSHSPYTQHQMRNPFSDPDAKGDIVAGVNDD